MADKCPHCGGKSGYKTDVRFKATRFYTWDGADVDTDNYEITSERNRQCADCGKLVRAHALTQGDSRHD